MRRGLAALLMGLIMFYRMTISPFLGCNCRFYPSCSVYALAVIHYHGPFYGGWVALRRLLRCHPFHEGGIDFPLR